MGWAVIELWVRLSHVRVFTHAPQRDAEIETETNLHTETRVTENTGHSHKDIVFPKPLNPFLPLRSSSSHSSPYSPFPSSPFSHFDLNLSFVTTSALFHNESFLFTPSAACPLPSLLPSLLPSFSLSLAASSPTPNPSPASSSKARCFQCGTKNPRGDSVDGYGGGSGGGIRPGGRGRGRGRW